MGMLIKIMRCLYCQSNNIKPEKKFHPFSLSEIILDKKEMSNSYECLSCGKKF